MSSVAMTPVGSVQPAQFGRVAPDLVRAGGMHPDQFQIGPPMIARSECTNVAGGELNYSSHFGPFGQ